MLKTKLGFTLFEVLIALAILSTTMVAAIMTTDNVLKRTVSIEKKLLAHWVAMNVLNSMQLKLTNQKIEITAGDITGTSEMRGQKFNWNLKIEKINIENIALLNMQVTVRDESEVQTAGLNQSNILDAVTRSTLGL